MGFASPLLSLTRFAWKVCLPAPTEQLPSNASLRNGNDRDLNSLSFNTQATGSILFQDSTTFPNVFTMRKSRTRRRPSQARRSADTSIAAPEDLQMTLPLQAAASSNEPRVLKIVQREPKKHPECLMISGRMADVCAALERMAGNDNALHA